ncbi:MAG: leucyl aminopeptidase [Rhodobacteraceae bacterium]|jgi:leucyl aminopeptidase|nr:leucyl aminopeptidase [Paracoccaceae bacterium]
MTQPPAISFKALDLEAIAPFQGRVVVFVAGSGKLDQAGRRVNRLTRGALERFAESRAFARLKDGEAADLAFPTGLAAEAVQVVRLGRRPGLAEARRAGAAIARGRGRAPLLVLAGALPRAAEVAYGLALRAYRFTDHMTRRDDEADGGDTPADPPVTIQVTRPEAVAQEARATAALAEAVYFTRDLVNEPANVLTTDDFAARLAAMGELGLEVEILDEPELRKLGMRALLAVGQGSESPSKVVVMRWNGGRADDRPLALIGKGVVFDTGGISLKPAQGMEEMTMDMGGAAVVAGVMRALALRKAKANVVGLVGLVENMPDGRAQRPGDIVRSMKGDTIEVINTDAEGRLVLADVMWYAQQRFEPRGMIDLATLTGAIIVALGHDRAGVFSNDDKLAGAVLRAADAEGEGAWRMPLGPSYDKLLKSALADMKNTGGRPAGAVTAAQFLARFVKDGMPWVHLDIAGVASLQKDTELAPKGATGWGVRTLDRLIRDTLEG